MQGILSVTENGALGFGESLSASVLLPKGRNDQTYYAANGTLPIGTDGFTAKVDASHHHGHPLDNPGLPSCIERTVVNDKLAFSGAYPILLDNGHSLIGTASVYASHDEDRLKNPVAAGNPQIAPRSQIRVDQLQFDYARVARRRAAREPERGEGVRRAGGVEVGGDEHRGLRAAESGVAHVRSLGRELHAIG